MDRKAERKSTAGWSGIALWGSWLVAVLLLTGPAFGQRAELPLSQTYIQQQRSVEQEIRQQLSESLPLSQKWQVDGGDWQSYYLLHFYDGIQYRTQQRWDNRAWIAGTGDYGTHQFYARMLNINLDWNHGGSYNGDDSDYIGPEADRLWYQFDLGQAAKTYGKYTLPFGLQTKVGRQYVEFGSGYALSLPLDAVLISAQLDRLEFQGLISKTILNTPDLVEPSRIGSGHMDRHFVGTQVRYRGQNHAPFAYVLWDLDENPQSFWNGSQGYGYDSMYTGIGSMGQLRPYVRYSTELVYESGRSYGNNVLSGRDQINAMGLDALLAYLMPSKYQPVFDLEYMFASGDADRRGSPIDPIGGNTRGADSSFVGFGFRDTGLALAPRLSNINIWRAGASVLPFTNRGFLRRLQIGTDWFLYAKNQATGAISDPAADEPSRYLGWEMDYYANWQITQELAATARYGVFFPGDAFSQERTRTFLLLGITYSF